MIVWHGLIGWLWSVRGLFAPVQWFRNCLLCRLSSKSIWSRTFARFCRVCRLGSFGPVGSVALVGSGRVCRSFGGSQSVRTSRVGRVRPIRSVIPVWSVSCLVGSFGRERTVGLVCSRWLGRASRVGSDRVHQVDRLGRVWSDNRINWFDGLVEAGPSYWFWSFRVGRVRQAALE